MRVELFDKNGEMRKFFEVMQEVQKAYFNELFKSGGDAVELARQAGITYKALRRSLVTLNLIGSSVHLRGARNG